MDVVIKSKSVVTRIPSDDTIIYHIKLRRVNTILKREKKKSTLKQFAMLILPLLKY